jgi:excisionase family DNA binding protein
LDGVERLLYTPIEAAKALGLSRTTVYNLMREERLAFVLIGSARRLPVAGLRRFVTAETSRQGFLT